MLPVERGPSVQVGSSVYSVHSQNKTVNDFVPSKSKSWNDAEYEDDELVDYEEDVTDYQEQIQFSVNNTIVIDHIATSLLKSVS